VTTRMLARRPRLSMLLAIASVCVTATAVAGCASATSSNANSYWYCWDQGDKAPHHLGHYVDGDHVCSDDELKGTGFNPR
jgi:hypothetical protein